MRKQSLKTLPLVEPDRKWRAIAWGYTAFGIIYLLTGHFHLREPVTLPLLLPDRIFGFTPWTVWIYQSQALLLIAALWMIKDRARLNLTLYSMALVSFVAFTVFLVYPVMLPRSTMAADTLTAQQFNLLYQIDSPLNCFPSLHVALATLAVLGTRNAIIFFWALLISVSTMTTKQHYFLDVTAGMVLAFVAWNGVRGWINEKMNQDGYGKDNL